MIMKAKIESLEKLARNMVGDGNSPNLYFVSDCGVCITITRNFSLAYQQWRALADRIPRIESALEDRKNGTIADVSPESDDSGAKLIFTDSSRQFGFNADWKDITA